MVKRGWFSFVALVLALVGCGGTEIRSTNSDGAGGSGGASGAGGAGGASGASGAGGAGASSILFDTLNNKSVDKIDLLFMIDNSTSMADKQVVLAQTVPDLVTRLLSPACVDASGAVGASTPADPSAPCPARTTREFKPITNIHIAIITSSVGGHGATICEGTEAENDHAELVGSRPRGAGTVYPPGADAFLDWNPATHPGEDVGQFASSFQSMVRAAGADGCGFPAQLEAVYRFLADPFPPQSIELQTCRGNAQCATPVGVDATILAQRKAFLRPDSLVAVIMLTDRNDCSIRDSDQYFYAAMVQDLLPKASTACGVNPNDPCCYSCGLAKPADCPNADPLCGPPPPSLNALDDAPSLRCFDQKRRFGIDFLYPIKRYANALSNPTLCTTTVDLAPDAACPARPDKSPGLVANPLFQDSVNGGVPRDPSLVYVAAITGVPWQLIAADPTAATLHYKTWDQLTNDNTWIAILGNPTPPPQSSPPVPPTDPHMQEAIDQRPGLPGPNTPPSADPINGHEWQITKRDDLQYACIFDKPPGGTPCDTVNCDCFSRQPGDNNPLCADASGQYVTNNQFKAKAYPSLRELELLHEFGRNGIVASLCPRNLVDPSAQDYGYRPAVDAIADRLKEALTAKCLPRKLAVAPDGSVACTMLEATADPARTCDAAMNRKEPDPSLIGPARQRLEAQKACDSDPSTALPDCSKLTFCEILKADDSCLTATPSPGSIGWCYVDPDAGLGDPSIVARCPANQRQIIRFVGDNTPVRNGIVLFTCGAALDGGATSMGTGTVPPL